MDTTLHSTTRPARRPPLRLALAGALLTLALAVLVPAALAQADFQTAQNLGLNGGFSPHSVAIGDLDGDGALDLATANANSQDVSVLLGNGDGTFATAQN
ncbi:MAG: FG-GAP repeat domain-containing protein, partial [Gaiellaceae bacterium]